MSLAAHARVRSAWRWYRIKRFVREIVNAFQQGMGKWTHSR